MTAAILTELLLWCLVVAAYVAQARALLRVHRKLDKIDRTLTEIAREMSKHAIADKVLRDMRR